MNEPIKYMTIIMNMLELYQIQLIALFKRLNSQQLLEEFRNKFEADFQKMKDTQIKKSIQENKGSQVCEQMYDYLMNNLRSKRTSQSQRYSMRSTLRSQDKVRMRFTGGITKNLQEQISQLDEIVKNHNNQEHLEPKMRMKWKLSQQNKHKEEQHTTIGNNNIQLLSYTIPQMQNSIKRLSLQSKYGRRSPDLDMYRTVDSKFKQRKKYVPRLF